MAKSTPYAAQPPVLYSRFTRSRRNLMVAGIASGLARYLGVDERWVRLFFIVGAFVGGAGALACLARHAAAGQRYNHRPNVVGLG